MSHFQKGLLKLQEKIKSQNSVLSQKINNTEELLDVMFAWPFKFDKIFFEKKEAIMLEYEKEMENVNAKQLKRH